MFKQIFVLAISAMLVSCLDSPEDEQPNNGESSSSGYSENSVKLSSVVSNSSPKPTGKTFQAATVAMSDCNVVSGIYQGSGTCIDPVSVTGNAASVNLHKRNTVVYGGVRIAGQSEFAEPEGSLYSGVDFDLFNPSAFVTNNTLRTQYTSREQYDSLNVLSAYYYVKFPVTFNNSTKWVTVLLSQYGQPFEQSTAVTNAISQCGLSQSETTQARFTDMNMIDGLSFQRGDYLFCVKDTDTEACIASDFQWLDESNNQLVATRPSNPKQAHALANNPIECQNDGGRIGFNFGDFGLYATISDTNQFKLWSDFSHGELSEQWNGDNGFPLGDSSLVPNNEQDGWVEPYYIYYHQACPNGNCGVTTEGSNLDVDFVFDTTGIVFIESMSEADMNAETSIGNILSAFHTKTQWAFDQRSINNVIGYDVYDIGGTDVQAIITIDRDSNNPPDGAVVSCPGDDRC